MEFCPKCKTLMLPSKKTAVCPKCGSRTKAGKNNILIKEKIAHFEKKAPKKMPKEIEGTYPIADTECPKCGNKTAYWWIQSVIEGEDAPDTQFFRCTRCRYTWRKFA